VRQVFPSVLTTKTGLFTPRFLFLSLSDPSETKASGYFSYWFFWRSFLTSLGRPCCRFFSRTLQSCFLLWCKGLVDPSLRLVLLSPLLFPQPAVSWNTWFFAFTFVFLTFDRLFSRPRPDFFDNATGSFSGLYETYLTLSHSLYVPFKSVLLVMLFSNRRTQPRR